MISKFNVPVFDHMPQSECCGCEACLNRCPQNAISMEQDQEGFYYPVVQVEKCNHCDQCIHVCPVLNAVEKPQLNETWAGYAKDQQIIRTSSSGGLFSILANTFLNSYNPSAVAAVVWSDDFKSVHHICSSDAADIFRMKKSKYIQSSKATIYNNIKAKLNEGYKVLFVGCPCEVAGLRSFFRRKEKNLYLVDLVCQGPTSPKAMSDFVNDYEKKYRSKISGINMRHVVGAWTPPYIKVDFENGKCFTKLLYETEIGRAVKLMQRPSCYVCHFAGTHRVSDLTLGDYHGADSNESYYNIDGTSIVVVNTVKGRELRSLLTPDNTLLFESNYDDVAKHNPRLIGPWKPHPKRANFVEDIICFGLKKAAKRSVSIRRKILYSIPVKYRKPIISFRSKLLPTGKVNGA